MHCAPWVTPAVHICSRKLWIDLSKCVYLPQKMQVGGKCTCMCDCRKFSTNSSEWVMRFYGEKKWLSGSLFFLLFFVLPSQSDSCCVTVPTPDTPWRCFIMTSDLFTGFVWICFWTLGNGIGLLKVSCHSGPLRKRTICPPWMVLLISCCSFEACWRNFADIHVHVTSDWISIGSKKKKLFWQWYFNYFILFPEQMRLFFWNWSRQ